MANRIYIQIRGSKKIFDFPIMEDVTFETTSQFQTWGSLVPTIDSYSDIVNVVAAAAGTIRSGFLSAKNVFDLPRWTKTDPIKFTTELSFYTKTNPKLDVFDKMKYLISLSILTRNSDGTYTVPGVGSRNIYEMLSLGKDTDVKSLYREAQNPLSTNNSTTVKSSDFDHKSKIIALEIPGMIYLNSAIITTCVPTISKQKTESGYPLWGKLMVTFSGLFPASDQIFSNVEVAVNQAYSQSAINRMQG